MKNFYKIWQLLSDKHKFELIFLFLFMIIGMGLETLGVGLVVPAIIIMLNPDVILNYPEANTIFNFLGNPTHKELIVFGMISLVIVYGFKALFIAFLSWKQTSFTSSVQVDLSQNLFTAYLEQPYAFHLQRNSAQLMNNISTPVGHAIKTLNYGLVLLSEMLVLSGISILIFIVEPLGSITILAVFGFSAWLFNMISRKKILMWGGAFQYHEALRIQRIQEGLGAVKDVKLLGREENFLEQYKYHNESSIDAAKRQIVLQSLPRLLFELLAVISLMVIVLVMLSQGASIDSVIPILGMFAAAAFRIMPSVNRILTSVQGIRFSLPMVQSLFSEFEEVKFDKICCDNSVLDFKNELTIENLFYRYPSSNATVLSDINCYIPQGSSIGFIGGSGAGKSTLIDIILGLLKPGEGKILLDGNNIYNNLRSWQDRIGYVPQSIYLTDDTLFRNIGFGLANDKINPEMVNLAIEAAQLKKFVDSLPLGLNTVVGERGVRLSGGQRQRIGIARALYHDPAVLVLDEATSSLDVETEKGVMDSVKKLKGDKTLIIVAHRLSTIEGCDYLYRLENGNLIDEGNATSVLEGLASKK